VPADAAPGAAQRLRAEGWTTVHGIEAGDARREAKRLGCSHVLADGKPVKLD
jgi:ATP phosphoribosyltransferase regulatory subunit